jgi:hypothetical protein
VDFGSRQQVQRTRRHGVVIPRRYGVDGAQRDLRFGQGLVRHFSTWAIIFSRSDRL